VLRGKLDASKAARLAINNSQEANQSIHAPGDIDLVSDPDIVGGGHGVTILAVRVSRELLLL
jgi:hypothetical protein